MVSLKLTSKCCALALLLMLMMIGSSDGACTFQRGFSQAGPGHLCYLSGRAMGRLDWQSDGNLVIYNDFNNAATWSTSTSGNPNAHIIFQTDGNLVIYGGNNNVLWASGTAGRGQTLVFQDDSNLVIYNSANQAVWSSGMTIAPPPGSRCLYRLGTTFSAGQACTNWNCHLQMETAGHVVIYQDTLDSHGNPYHRVMWSPANGQSTVFQNDGNFVVYGANNAAIWWSSTQNTGHSLIFQNDCNLVIYSSGGQAVWSSGTSIGECDCDYHPGGCTISQPAPTGYKCTCSYAGFWSCYGTASQCDNGQMSGPCAGDCTTKACCSGDCKGY